MRRLPNSNIDFSSLKVAIVHEWFVDYSGSERVLEQMLNTFPQADLFAQVEFLPDNLKWFIKNKQVKTSFIQNLPFAKKLYRNYLPLMPFAVEQFDLSGYDLIISSSHAVAKGVITGPDQIHICMCYSPMRYAWDLTHQYLKESNLQKGLKGWVTKYLLHKLRMWDYRTANGVDNFMAISKFIARRVKKVYGRESLVIYPPVNTDAFKLSLEKEDFYLAASRMVPYKKLDIIVEAFKKMPEKKLIVIGDGPDFNKIKSMAGKNTTMMGFQPFEVLYDHMKRARAFVFAAEEDFGIIPIEAQACGTPVIAYGKGGALETVVDEKTGLFFKEQTCDAIVEAVNRFEKNIAKYEPKQCRENALKFCVERFRSEFESAVVRILVNKDDSIPETQHTRRLSFINKSTRVDLEELVNP